MPRTKYPRVRGLDWNRIRNKYVKHFIVHVDEQLKRQDVKLWLPMDHKTVDGDCGFRINGYFNSGDEPDLAVGCNKPMRLWLPILVHEYSHFEQWLYDVPAWRKGVYAGKDTSCEMFEWLHGSRRSIRTQIENATRARDLELDCERRTLENIKRFELPLDVEKYAQRSSAYIQFYNYALIRRKWYRSGHEPFVTPEIIKRMPKTLAGSYSKIAPELVLLLDKYCAKR